MFSSTRTGAPGRLTTETSLPSGTSTGRPRASITRSGSSVTTRVAPPSVASASVIDSRRRASPATLREPELTSAQARSRRVISSRCASIQRRGAAVSRAASSVTRGVYRAAHLAIAGESRDAFVRMARLRLEPRIRITRTRVAFAACAALLALFATLSWLAVRTKSPTADEPLHAVAAYVKLFHAGFRVDPEDPPLVGYWAMIPHDRRTLLLDKTVPSWHVMPDYLWRQWEWVIPTLYRTPENRPEPFIDRSRAMMLVWGVVLGALIAVWAGQLSGAVAAIAATALYALDPNFLGHAPLVKNDVPLALAAFALLHATWRTGERVTPFRAAWLPLLAGVALNVKFSAVILVPIIAIVLLIRALMPRPWIV